MFIEIVELYYDVQLQILLHQSRFKTQQFIFDHLGIAISKIPNQ